MHWRWLIVLGALPALLLLALALLAPDAPSSCDAAIRLFCP